MTDGFDFASSWFAFSPRLLVVAPRLSAVWSCAVPSLPWLNVLSPGGHCALAPWADLAVDLCAPRCGIPDSP